MKKVYLSEHIAPSARKRLEESYQIVDTFADIADIEGIITRNLPITRQMMQQAKQLKIISVHGTGWDLVDLEAANELGIAVKNVPGENALSVAELAVGFMLALNRKFKQIDRGLLQGRWQKPGDGSLSAREVTGKTLGLVGTGNVSGHVARIMRAAFNMHVLCYNPHKTAAQCAEMGYEKTDTLQELFARCDFVSVSVPFTEETRGMISAEVLQNANPGLVLVNTARGGVVDQKALYDALTTGKIAAAASDVFAVEPPEKDDPLLRLENFIATPHIGATTEEALDRVGNRAVDHIFAYVK